MNRASTSLREYRETGFTLIEITVALAIFAMSVVILSQGFLNALTCQSLFMKQNDGQNDFYTIKQIIFLQPSLETLKDKGGEFTSVSGEIIHWNTTVSPTKISDLYRIETFCTWPDRHQKKWDFYLWNPKWKKAKDRNQDLEEKKRKIKADQENASDETETI